MPYKIINKGEIMKREKWIVAGAILGILGFICVPIVKASWNNTGAWQRTADCNSGDNVSS